MPAVDEGPLEVEISHDGRLRRRIHWDVRGSHVLIRVPRGMARRDVDPIVADIVARVKRTRARAQARADQDLEACARQINRAYFGGEIRWNSIRWVSNMRKRLGSCSTGGPTDGDIRISDQIKGWPQWVIDYVVAHEMVHTQVSGHGPDFWALVSRYPKADRAEGFLLGVAFGLARDADEWL
ncbi:MAG TPA: M48 family metallopeptidase [Anaerolineae bacterium]|nr:M48 family metallopeptidase [Anaerolineae bacterium]